MNNKEENKEGENLEIGKIIDAQVNENSETTSSQQGEKGIPSQEAQDANEAKKALKQQTVVWAGHTINIDHTQDSLATALGINIDDILTRLKVIFEKKHHRTHLCQELPDSDCACMSKSEIGVEMLKVFTVEEIVMFAIRGVENIFDENMHPGIPPELLALLKRGRRKEE